MVSACLCLASCPQSPFSLPHWAFPDSQVVPNISSLCSWASFLHVPFSASPDSAALQQTPPRAPAHKAGHWALCQELPPGPWPLSKSPIYSSISFFICEMGMAQPYQKVLKKTRPGRHLAQMTTQDMVAHPPWGSVGTHGVSIKSTLPPSPDPQARPQATGLMAP